MTMNRKQYRAVAMTLIPAICLACAGASYASPNGSRFVDTVEATHPAAFYTLQAPTGSSHVGDSTFTSQGTVTPSQATPPTGQSPGGSVRLDGHSGWIGTTAQGGIGASGSMMAWVNLQALPSRDGHFFYVAGESQNGNDFDVQFEQDNALRFYTAAGSHVTYTPALGSLTHLWHMIVVTFDVDNHTRRIYWDGKLAAFDTDAGAPNKTSQFSIGASTVFGGRWLDGYVADVALWDHSLSAGEVAKIYHTAITASKR